MPENIVIALEITLIGMGMVFLGICVLWLFMIGLTKFTFTKKETGTSETIVDNSEHELRKKAAAIAVATALAKQLDGNVSRFPLPPTAIVSAWQLTMRTRQLDREARPK